MELESADDVDNEIELQVDANLYLGGMYASFQDRSNTVPFLDSLLDEIGREHNDVCYLDKFSNRIQSIQPWMATDFDYTSGCDTSVVGNDWTLGLRAVDSVCDGIDANNENLDCNQTFPLYFDTLHNFMAQSCKDEHGTLLKRKSVRSEPVCQRVPTSLSTCNRKQGTLGGYKGHRVTDLQKTQTPNSSPFVGAWTADNNLIRQANPLDLNTLPILQILSSDIAGHSFQFNIRDGQMQIDRMFLSSNANSASLKTKLWMRGIENFWQYQHEILSKRPFFSEITAGDDWMCPLAWVDSLSHSASYFAIHVPSPQRNSRRFKHITQNYHYASSRVDRASIANRLGFNFATRRFMTPSKICRDPNLQTCKGLNNLKHALDELRRIRRKFLKFLAHHNTASPYWIGHI